MNSGLKALATLRQDLSFPHSCVLYVGKNNIASSFCWMNADVNVFVDFGVGSQTLVAFEQGLLLVASWLDYQHVLSFSSQHVYFFDNLNICHILWILLR